MTWEIPPLEPISKGAYFYKVHYAPSELLAQRDYVRTDGKEVYLVGLKRNKTYEISVEITAYPKYGPQSAPIYCLTKAESKPEKPPQNVKCEAVSSEQLHTYHGKIHHWNLCMVLT